MSFGGMDMDHGRTSLGALALAIALALGGLAAPAALAAQGVLRDLACRGNTGMVLRVDQDPSPRDTSRVVMVLEYRRSTKTLGGNMRSLDPGTCSWNPMDLAGTPPEPGRVRFEVPREGQPWLGTGTRIMDTTVRAAVFFPDPITLPRYLLDPNRYWRFYVNDVTNLSPSFGAMFESGTPTYVRITGPVQLGDVRRDLLCRGGTSGLLYGGGASVGNNLAKVQLTYRVSPNLPGPTGSGLAAGSCAWTDRRAMPPEPGKIWFITASNAQLRQTQSGVPLDRSPTAAERYPDVRSIPEYLKDPARYWTFSVVSRKPDSAVANGPWKRDLTNVVAGARTAATATTRAQPTTTSGAYTPGAGSATSRPNTLFDIRNVSVTAGLEGVVIRFEAAANSNPKVTITPASVGATLTLTVASSAGSGGMMRYVAASPTKLPRNMSYNYGIIAAATGNARQNSTSGTFRTLSQRVAIKISEINLLNDGDADSDGELKFDFNPCTRSISSFRVTGKDGAYVSMGDGRQWVVIDLKSVAEVPDQFRILVGGHEDDSELLDLSSARFPPKLSCSRPNPPGRNTDYEWNSLVMDVDLTKYPGPKAGQSFVRRSQPPSGGSKLMFEIRGYWEVTRQ
jgi:hypothetical protein